MKMSDFETAEVGRAVPFTSGLEIEQSPRDINLRVLCRRFYDNCHHRTYPDTYNHNSPYDWCHDLSGPVETQIGPTVFAAGAVKKFIEFVNKSGATWVWRNEYGHHTQYDHIGCGSHLHFRLREELFDTLELPTAWAILWNTLSDLSLLLLPLLCHGSTLRNVYNFRSSANRWCQINSMRYSPRKFQTDYLLNRNAIRNNGYHITANRRSGKPLTIELRLNEAHPAVSYFTINYMSMILREIYKREWSIKISNRSKLIGQIDDIAIKQYYTNTSLWTLLDSTGPMGPIEFEAGREVPRCKTYYRSYLECFDDILTKYWQSRPPMVRVGNLFRQRGIPYKNSNALWNTFAPRGAFRWDQPHITVPY